MPLAAAINPAPVPGATAIRAGGAGAPDRSGSAAGAFEALLGEAASADARSLTGARAARPASTANARPEPALASATGPQADVRFGADLTDQAAADTDAPIVLSVADAPVETGADAMNAIALPADGDPDLAAQTAAARPAQSAVASGEVAQIDADRALATRDPGQQEALVKPGASASVETGAKDAVQTPVEAPAVAAMPAADLAAGDGTSDGKTAESAAAPDRLAPGNDQRSASLQPTDGSVERQPAPDGAPAADPDADPEVPVVPAPLAQTPASDAPGNAASARRDADPRRSAKGGDAGKAGDEPGKPAPSGARSQEPAAPQPATPTKAGAPDLPQPPRSADAFQALLQAQTRPAAEAAAPRAGDMPLDPSGDSGLRSAPDRAAELLRTSGPTPPGAAPRFAPQTVQTLAAQIVRRQSEGGRVFDIRLDPPELGRVGVRLEMGKDQMVKAMLSAERPDTLQELQRTARDLERALNEAGLNLAENGLSFSLGGERGERDAPGFEAPPGARSVVEIDAARPGAPVTALYGFALARAAGLDIQA